jgi:PHD/YefM family antitoxin component YafN of YafNO toxin-antitoxin module
MSDRDPYKPEFIVRDGKPTAVILPIEDYQALLEQLEQQEDLAAIRRMTEADWQTVAFEDYLKESDGGGEVKII